MTYSPEREAFRIEFNVSRETMERFDAYLAILTKWNNRINLVSKSTLATAWQRHFSDSLQLWPLRPDFAAQWIDLGSGAGFPGLVMAIMAKDVRIPLKTTLIESDQRKSAFLHAAALACDVSVTVLSERIEAVPPRNADILSARALAPLDILLGYAEKHRDPSGICLFPKGETVHKEIEDALRRWQFEYRIHSSRTDPRAAIVEIGALARA